MDIKKQVEYFNQLSYEARKEKVIEMLNNLQWSHEVFAIFYKTVKSLPFISDNVLHYLYQSILEISDEIEAGRKDEAQNKIKKIAEMLMVTKKQEEMEKEQERSPDELLKNI